MNDNELELIKKASTLLKENYKKNRHHVACLLKTEDALYESLHLDIEGFDVCAEPIALSNALSSGDSKFKIIVSVAKDEEGNIDVVTPCGNCRQMLIQYAPDIRVILDRNGHKVPARSLLPYPYKTA